MGKAEEIHELIYTNLCLLKAGGHRINFQENMFKEHNLPGFEAVGYALLMIIDPTECKSKIPWPLVNDKAQAREFRTNFTKFIKMINTKYNAKIPEINSSSLQFPGGMRFLDFIYKLSTFALELELKKALNSEEQENMIPRPLLCKTKDQKVKLTVTRGALHLEQEALLRFKEYEANGPVLLKKMNVCLDDITTNCKSTSEQLEAEVSSLNFDDETKASLLDIDDSTAITEYNKRTEQKCEEFENNSRKLRQIHYLADQCCQPGKMLLPTREETQCLDGHKLEFIRFLNELAGGSVVNVEGDVKMPEVVRAAHTVVTRLTTSPGSPSLLLPAQDLQVRCRSSTMRLDKAEAALKCLSQENKQAVDKLRPLAYSTLKNKKIPEAFKHLKERPPLNLVLPQTVAKSDAKDKPGKKRKSIGTIIHGKNKVVCSFKTKREPKKHVSSTPFFKTPACRKSLYSTLPTGRRHKRMDEVKQVEVTPDTPTPLSPALSTIRESAISESSLTTSRAAETASPRPSPAPRCGRKSLDDIIQRFHKLKQSMNTSSNSRNESDTCNESET